MFGFFQFGQPQFGDAPVFGSTPPPSSGGGGAAPGGRRKFHKNLCELTRQEQAANMERILTAFLNNL